MQQPVLIIVTGLSATGKTTLGRTIAHHFSMPFISKDDIKERLFDTLGWSDRDWSRKVGIAAYRLMDYLLAEELSCGRSVVVESNFNPQYDNARFRNLHQQYNMPIIQVVCTAETKTLVSRFEARAAGSDRHPGHAEIGSLDEFRQSLSDSISEPLDINSDIVTVDTTDFDAVDDAYVLSRIAALLTAQGASV